MGEAFGEQQFNVVLIVGVGLMGLGSLLWLGACIASRLEVRRASAAAMGDAELDQVPSPASGAASGAHRISKGLPSPNGREKRSRMHHQGAKRGGARVKFAQLADEAGAVDGEEEYDGVPRDQAQPAQIELAGAAYDQAQARAGTTVDSRVMHGLNAAESEEHEL